MRSSGEVGRPAPLAMILSKLFSKAGVKFAAGLVVALILAIAPSLARGWSEDEFERRPLFAYPLPRGHDSIVGNPVVYQIQKGDTLLDVGRWFGVTAKEISDANGHIDWWTPPVGKKVVLPTEHVLPDTQHRGLILNIPEMRLYYFYPAPIGAVRRSKPGLRKASFSEDGDAPPVHGRAHRNGSTLAHVVYTFPVGLGRFDWKTPVGSFTVRGKTRDPTWVVPDDIYKEHLERDGEADHMIPGGDPDNPLGHYRIELTLPQYALHGTNVPWGVGMEVSHGCVRLYPEDIERLFSKVKVGTPGSFVYQPVKFGWRGDALYVEVHDDLYGRYPGLWNLATQELQRRDLEDQVDMAKLEKAVVDKTGMPTYVMPGPNPDAPIAGAESASN